MSILDSVLNSLSRIPDVPRATREYFRDHTLNDAFDLLANNSDRYLQALHAPNCLQGLAGSTLSAGQLLWGIPVGLRDMGRVAIEASPRGWQYTVASVGSFMIHEIVQGAGMLMGSVSSWTHGSLNDQNSFRVAREVTLTAGAGGMLLMGARNITRGGGNFFNAARTTFQNAGEMSLSHASATAAIASGVAVLPAAGLAELGASLCMMNAVRPIQVNDSSPTSTRARPDEELIRVPGKDFIQGAELPGISFPDELPLRRVGLSPFLMLRSAVTNRIWDVYISQYQNRPWAMIGRLSEEHSNINERGRWTVVVRGESRAELEAWLENQRAGDRVIADDEMGSVFDFDTCSIHQIIRENASQHRNGFSDSFQPVVEVDWWEAVAGADGIGRFFHGRRGFLPTEAEWEAGARGHLERMNMPVSEFLNFVRGPQINNQIFRGRIPRRENFVEIVDSSTLEFGRRVFTDPNHPRVQSWLRRGVLGAWRVFAGDLENNIWSSVFEERRATRSVLEEPANTLDLLGMNGNIYEWVDDWHESYPQSNAGEAILNPRGSASGDTRVFRGGSWRSNGPGYLRAARRGFDTPGGRGNIIGLRFGVLPQD